MNRKVLDLTKISSTASIELKVKFNVEDRYLHWIGSAVHTTNPDDS